MAATSLSNSFRGRGRMRGSEIGIVGEGEDRKRGKFKNIVSGTTKLRV